MELVGRYYSKVTPKGRIALPASYRKIIGNVFYIARWYEKCLVVITLEGWEGLSARLTQKNKYITQAVRDTDRFIVSSLFRMETDSQGRMVIPKLLREYADIEEDVVFLGLGDRIEIWDKNLWSDREEYLLKNSTQILEGLAKESNE